jgi:hypothetical protein
MFELWEFDLRHRAGYLSDVGFFSRELGVSLSCDEEDNGQGDALFINIASPDVGVNLEIQPPDLMEDEAFELAIA